MDLNPKEGRKKRGPSQAVEVEGVDEEGETLLSRREGRLPLPGRESRATQLHVQKDKSIYP